MKNIYQKLLFNVKKKFAPVNNSKILSTYKDKNVQLFLLSWLPPFIINSKDVVLRDCKEICNHAHFQPKF